MELVPTEGELEKGERRGGMGKKHQQERRPPRSASGASFFKVMIGDFKRCLAVPPSFTWHMKARRDFTLRSHPFVKSWHVEVKEFANHIIFQTGWGEFVEDHALGLGEFLVFTYDGHSGFDVDVYGIDGCKKHNLEGDNNVEPLQENADAEKAIHPLVEYSNKQFRREVLVFGRTKSGPLRLGRRAPRTLKRERELEAALPFKLRNPYFVAIWRTTRADMMTIPHDLAKEYKFGEKKFSAHLHDHLGRSWLVKVCQREDGRVDFTKGWTEFSRDNFLTEGDVCVFEFTQAGNIIQTHLLQVERGTGKLVKKNDVPRHLVRKHNLGVKKSVAPILWGNMPVNVGWWPDSRPDLGIGKEAFARGNSLGDGDACTFKFSKEVFHCATSRMVMPRSKKEA